MGKDGEGKDGRVPAVDVTVVGVDVGVRRSVVAFVGVRAGLLNELAVIYARQNGVSLIPLGVYDVMTRAYVAEVEYPGIDKYRGNELTSNIVGKVLGAVIRASHSVQRVRDGLVGLAFEDLRRFSGHKRDLARARVVWEFMVNEFGGVVSRCPAVKVSWFWMSYKGEVMMPVRDSIPVILVEPEYTSSVCPRCGNYLGRARGKVTCNYCGFEGDRDVIGAINIALRGFLILMKCVREGVIRGGPRASGPAHRRVKFFCLIPHAPCLYMLHTP